MRKDAPWPLPGMLPTIKARGAHHPSPCYDNFGRNEVEIQFSPCLVETAAQSSKEDAQSEAPVLFGRAPTKVKQLGA